MEVPETLSARGCFPAGLLDNVGEFVGKQVPTGVGFRVEVAVVEVDVMLLPWVNACARNSWLI
jgi:hypothetical protein